MMSNRLWILCLSAAAIVATVASEAGDGNQRKLTKGQQEAFLRAFEFNKIPERKDRKKVEIPEFLARIFFTTKRCIFMLYYYFPD